jgi:tetratricopeptide (TPR) repeat protein
LLVKEGLSVMAIDSKIFLILIFVTAEFVSSCRTAKPKIGPEVLSGSELPPNASSQTGVDEADGSMEEAANMWSPANRRASAMFQYLVAQRKMLHGDSAAAESHFEMSYNLDPNAFTGSQLVRSKIISDPQNDEGLTEARRMSLLYPLDANLRLLYAQALLLHLDYKESEVQLKRAIDLDPRLEDAYTTLIKCYQVTGQQKSAIDVAYKMTRNNPQSFQSWTLLSRLLISAKRVKEAIEPARKAWEMQENNPELALIYALTLDLNKRGKEAVKLYEQLYRFNPGNTDLVQRMVGLYKELGNLSNALSLLEDMIENSAEEVPGLRMQKVIILWEMERADEALREILALEKELPESDRVSFMAGIALAKANRRKEAIQRFGRIQSESPLKADAMKQQALVLRDDGDLKGALDVLKTLSERKDCDVQTYLVWGEFLSESGEVAQAISVIEAGLVKFAGDKKLLFSRGAYLERKGDRKSAEASFRDLIAKDPDNAAALNYLGYMFAEEGSNLDEAESLIQRALKLQPANGGYLDSLGWIYYKKGQYKRAMEVLERAVALDKNEGVIWEHLGDALVALGQKKDALEKYREALKLKNEPRDEARIRKKFEDLQKELAGG